MLNLTVSDVEFITDRDGGISSSVADKKKVERDMIKDWLTMYDLLKEIAGCKGIALKNCDGEVLPRKYIENKIRALIGGE